MPHGWEQAHVGSDLGDHGLGGGRTKPRHLLQPLDDVMKGRQRALNAGVEGCNAVLQLLNRPQMLTEQESMMLPDTAGENFHQLSPRAAEALMAKRGELFASVSPAIMAFNMRRPLAPMMSVITEHSLMFASSRTVWIRCTCCTISRVNCLRVRVRSRSS
jgi:hypothetical protein